MNEKKFYERMDRYLEKLSESNLIMERMTYGLLVLTTILLAIGLYQPVKEAEKLEPKPALLYSFGVSIILALMVVLGAIFFFRKRK